MENTYDLVGQVVKVNDSAGGSVTNWHNIQGLIVAVSNAFGRVQALAYDIEDHATNVVDANGVSITNIFDELDRLKARTYPDGGIEKFSYSARGLIGYTNQLGYTNSYTYDALCRKIGETITAHLELTH
jgi:YD repeat-containing protein